MTKVVWLPNETDYSYCEFVAPNTPYLSKTKSMLFTTSAYPSDIALFIKIQERRRTESTMVLCAMVVKYITHKQLRISGFKY